MKVLTGGICAGVLFGAQLWAGQNDQPLERIGFGSCYKPEKSTPLWADVKKYDPQLWIWLGDNFYNDWAEGKYIRFNDDPEAFTKGYEKLKKSEGMAALQALVPDRMMATWDDHDYGRNDGGADYPYKAASKAYFMSFFGVAADAPMRSREGVYDARWITRGGHRIQLLLLDTRSFRSPLVEAKTDVQCPRHRWGPNDAPEATMLGAAQWAWLASRLREPADLHLLVSSIQVIPDAHCYEKWANFPRERERLLSQIDGASAPVLILSGDRHLGEISRLPATAARRWPLLELTSSGLNSAGAGEGERKIGRAHV